MTAAKGQPLDELSSVVLIVEDEALVCHMAKAVLASAGLGALTAGDGQEALALYAAHRERIGLVLLDLGLPGMDGVDTLRGLQRIDPAVRVVLTSGYELEHTQHRLAPSELAGFIRKPYMIEELVRTVRGVLAGVAR